MTESVSVIIPCYNVEETVVRALDSIFGQSYPIFEVICVDDCSTDNTKDVILDYKDCRVKYIKNIKNSGPSYSRNIGFKQSVGSIVAFLDADDYWHSDKVKAQIALLRYFDFEVVSCSYFDGELHRVKETIGYRILTLSEIMLSNIISTPSVLMHRSAFLLFNEEMKYSEDFDLWLRLIRNGSRFGYINKDLVYLDKLSFGEGGLSSDLLSMELGEIKTIWNNSTKIYEKTFYCIYSLVKFLRRLFIVYRRKIKSFSN
ncbi:glycosyltransferase family 2 protein [Vibrio ouci]|uniref:Glycosyltransferase n=1 Tax=Vibrio ouci TaxID=2499078 RepID=A0A4Y8WJL3_9VIBR|nr:glycosyltransferase family 2 protein [Vibrio ouci]TFH92999.1 glycosyltransferase [Vibrio ouci]